MTDLRTGLIVTAQFSQWVMAVIVMALFLDPNLSALFSAILLSANADLALHRVRDEQRWVAYQSEVVRAHRAVLPNMKLDR